MTRMFASAIVAVLAVAPFGATAQQLTDEELLQLFHNQRDAFQEARADPLGRTRSLVLVTVDDVDPSSAPAEASAGAAEAVSIESAPDVAAAGADANIPLAGLAGDAVPAATPEGTQMVFGQLAPELQVNVRIEFGFDSAALAPSQLPLLSQLCNVMQASDIQLFRIVGHTDASGTVEYNERLSLLRAQEVQRYLVRDCGIAADRLEAVGMGPRFLFNEENPRSGENRRVEFQALG